MDLGCPLLRGSSDRRLRRCAATARILQNSQTAFWGGGGAKEEEVWGIEEVGDSRNGGGRE